MGESCTRLKGIEQHKRRLDIEVIGAGGEFQVGSVIGQFITLVKFKGLVGAAKVHCPVRVLTELELLS